MAATLEQNIKAFQDASSELEKHHMGKFAVFHDKQCKGVYDTFDTAAREAVKLFDDDVFLIRQVGKSPEIPMPASVAFRPIHAPG